MAVAVADLAVGVEHEPLRPVAARLELLGKDDAQDLADRLMMAERQEEFHRPLADIARAPGRRRILFEAARHRQMHHGVLGEPGEDGGERSSLGLVGGETRIAGDAAPEAARLFQRRAAIDAALIFRREAFGFIRIGQRADERE